MIEKIAVFLNSFLGSIDVFWLKHELNYLCLINLNRNKVYLKLYFPLSHP